MVDLFATTDHTTVMQESWCHVSCPRVMLVMFMRGCGREVVVMLMDAVIFVDFALSAYVPRPRRRPARR